MKQCRRLLEDDLGLVPKSLDCSKDFITKEVDKVVDTLLHPSSASPCPAPTSKKSCLFLFSGVSDYCK